VSVETLVVQSLTLKTLNPKPHSLQNEQTTIMMAKLRASTNAPEQPSPQQYRSAGSSDAMVRSIALFPAHFALASFIFASCAICNPPRRPPGANVASDCPVYVAHRLILSCAEPQLEEYKDRLALAEDEIIDLRRSVEEVHNPPHICLTPLIFQSIHLSKNSHPSKPLPLFSALSPARHEPRVHRAP
jgi:hypothetical protein